MAQFTTEGIDSIADEMAWLGEAAGETADEMLLAGRKKSNGRGRRRRSGMGIVTVAT